MLCREVHCMLQCMEVQSLHVAVCGSSVNACCSVWEFSHCMLQCVGVHCMLQCMEVQSLHLVMHGSSVYVVMHEKSLQCCIYGSH